MKHPPFLRLALMLAAASGNAAAQSAADWQFGAVLDLSHTTRAPALGSRDKGLQLGHSDLTARGALGSSLKAQLTATVATHDGKLEKGIEEAWVETTRLPAGLQARVGRFASQVGHLNQQHPHADDFVDRPLLYRGFFGGHWNDDGLRLNWTAPTFFYLMFGAEAFGGKRLVEDAVNGPGKLGATTLAVKAGADIGRQHSWQLGLSHIQNRREAAAQEDEHDADAADHAHAHAHGSLFSGRRTWMIDATWKWAPEGNNRERQLRLGFEAARITRLNRFASPRDRHDANAVTVVWRFHPKWEAGGRADWLRVRMPHGEHFHSGLLREHALMLAWKPTHMQSLRLQYTTQRDAVDFDDPAKRAVQLQYVLAFGAHGAHAY